MTLIIGWDIDWNSEYVLPNFSDIWIEIQILKFNNMHLNCRMQHGKHFCWGPNVSIVNDVLLMASKSLSMQATRVVWPVHLLIAPVPSKLP